MASDKMRRERNWLSSVIRLAASPIFFLLAGVNYVGRQGMDALMIAVCRNPIQDVVADLGLYIPNNVFVALGSMWLMYGLMGVIHIGAWIEMFGSFRPRKVVQAEHCET